MIHAGYSLLLNKLEEKVRQQLLSHLSGTKITRKKEQKIVLELKENPYTAMVYCHNPVKGDAPEMWFSSHKENKIARLRYLYVDFTKQIAVTEATIDGSPVYITLSKKDHGFRPFQIKKMANTGALGTKIELSPVISVECTPYAYSRNNNIMIFPTAN